MSLLLAVQGAPQETLVRDESIPVESRSAAVALQVDVLIPIDLLQILTLSVDIAIDVSGLKDLAGSIPVESLVGQARNESVPIDSPGVESIVPVFDVNVFDPEVFRTGIQLDRNESLAIDNTGIAVAEVVAVFDVNVFDPEVFATGIQVDRDESIPIDSTAFVFTLARDETIPIEDVGGIVRDESIPVESTAAAAGIVRDDEIPVEHVGGLTRDDEIPIDSTSAQVFALVRDEAIPIDASTAPVVPSDLLVFYGAGAPWPPSWLVRAPLLNRTQHCAVLYIGGTSWSTFTGSAPPPRPSKMVKPVKPKRIRRSRPTPAHPGYVRAGHSSIIWIGGRSTEATRIDRAAVMKQDEEDFMTLLPLL